MSQSSQPTESAPVRQQSRSRGLFSSELADLFVPPLKVGGWSGEFPLQSRLNYP